MVRSLTCLLYFDVICKTKQIPLYLSHDSDPSYFGLIVHEYANKPGRMYGFKNEQNPSSPLKNTIMLIDCVVSDGCVPSHFNSSNL